MDNKIIFLFLFCFWGLFISTQETQSQEINRICEEGFIVSDILEDGRIIILSNGTKWLSEEPHKTLGWGSVEITVCKYSHKKGNESIVFFELLDTDDNEKIHAHKLE